jgi:penicillin-binding protein 1A
MALFKQFRQQHPELTRWIFIGVTFGISFAVGFAYAAWALVCTGGRCPSVQVLDQYQPRQTSKLYAVDGRFIAELGLERRTLVSIKDIPPVLKDAFVSTEDKRFYKHHGIDWMRVPGTLWSDIRSRSFSQGFSTITMQLAGNIFPERINRRERSGFGALTRKLKEAKVARDIEASYSKDKILELYLNQIYLGNGAYGVETASQRYFGKSVKDVNVAEAATLAALPRSPTRYDPRRFPDRAVQRRNTVIELMRQNDVLNDADASLAKAYPLRLGTKAEAGETAPYFVEWIRQILDQQFGRQLYEQGLKVYTTLDIDMQSAAERGLERQLRAIESGRFGTFKHVTYESYQAQASDDQDRDVPASPYLQGAFVALDARTGAVRAMVGGRDFDDSKFNRATQALRQPGSTFKPIVYSDAIQNGRPLSYPIDDSPLSVPQAGGGRWEPQNYDLKFEGIMPMRRALFESRNLATIRLGMELGEQSVIDMARRFGLTTPIPPYPSIHIGAAGAIPIEMVSSYTTFANLGTRSTPQAIVRVENAKGDILWTPDVSRITVLSPEEAWLMVSVMKDVVRRGTASASVGSVFKYPAGGKTGTTNDYSDVWFIGYTSDLVAGLWMGFDKPSKIINNAQGGRLAAPAWSAFMNEVYRRRPAPQDWAEPPGIISRTIDGSTNMLATPYCPASVVYAEFYIPGTEPLQECNVHTAFTIQPDTTQAGATVPRDTSHLVGPPAPVVPGATPTPRPVPPTTRPPQRDTSLVFPRRDSTGRVVPAGRDSGRRVRPDTANPFYIPPAKKPKP